MKKYLVILCFSFAVPQLCFASERTLYEISSELAKSAKQMSEVEEEVKDFILNAKYKSEDEKTLATATWLISRTANAVIVGQAELCFIAPCVTEYRLFYATSVKTSVKDKIAILDHTNQHMKRVPSLTSNQHIIIYAKRYMSRLDDAMALFQEIQKITEDYCKKNVTVPRKKQPPL